MVTPDGAGAASTGAASGTGDEEELERLRAEVADLRTREADLVNREVDVRTREAEVLGREEARRPRRRPGWRAPVATVLIVVGCLLAPVSVLGVWAANQVSNTDRYVATIEPLIHEP